MFHQNCVKEWNSALMGTVVDIDTRCHNGVTNDELIVLFKTITCYKSNGLSYVENPYQKLQIIINSVTTL
jgi:hypothetical protein